MTRRRQSAKEAPSDPNSPAAILAVCASFEERRTAAMERLETLVREELKPRDESSLVDGLVCIRYSLEHNVRSLEDLADWLERLVERKDGGKE